MFRVTKYSDDVATEASSLSFFTKADHIYKTEGGKKTYI
jgi:hypothetical protein